MQTTGTGLLTKLAFRLRSFLELPPGLRLFGPQKMVVDIWMGLALDAK
jgi:hypothetical protein